MSGIHFAAFFTVACLFHSGTAFFIPAPFLQTPQKVSARYMNSTTARVAWEQLMFRNHVKHYEVFYTEMPVDRLKTQIVASGQMETTIHNLKPFTEYSISVLAKYADEEYMSKKVVLRAKSEGHHSSTEKPAPLGAPDNVKAVPMRCNIILLSWHRSKDGRIRGYKVFYTDRPGDSGTPVMHKTVDSNTRETSIDNLKANTEYSIYVLAFSDQSEGERSETVVVRTHEEDPGKPRQVTVKAVNSSSVVVQWQPPVNQCDRISGYRVHYVKDGKGHPISQLLLDPGMREVTISGLEPDTSYIVELSAFSLPGNGPRMSMLVQTKRSDPSEYILLSTGNAFIRVVSNPDSDNATAPKTHAMEPIVGMNYATLLAFDPVDKSIYWVNYKKQEKSVQRFHETGEEASKVIDLESEPFDMDIDPYSRTLYLTYHDAIKVVRIDNSNSLIGEIKVGRNFRAQAIVLHPEKGVMYYVNADLPPYPSHIEMAQMDGSRFNAIEIPESASRDDSISLALDKRNNRLYLARLFPGRIQSIDLNDGNYDFHIEVQNERPRGITIMGDFLYWFDGAGLSYINTKSKKKASIPLAGKVTDVIHVNWNISILWHPCSKHNGGCSHFCFLKENKPQCSCPAGWMMKPDMQTCYKVAKCDAHEIRCYSGQCIPSVSLCNGSKDCDDGSDEVNCDGCGSLKFRCYNGKCIHSVLRCDYHTDCDDGSDEVNCDECGFSEFKCYNGQCIPSVWRCDGSNGCDDGSDEVNCDECGSSEFKCVEGGCIPSVSRCDGRNDCDDGSDEVNCDGCGSSEFKCVDGGCIGKEFVCDGFHHCTNGSDEEWCFTGDALTKTDHVGLVNITDHADSASTTDYTGAVGITNYTTATNITKHSGAQNTIDPALTKSQIKNKSKISKEITIAIVVVVVAVILLACVLIFLLWRHKTKIGEKGPNYEEVMTVRMQSSDQPGGNSSGEDDSGLHVRIVRGKSLTSVASSESEVCLGPSCAKSSERLVK